MVLRLNLDGPYLNFFLMFVLLDVENWKENVTSSDTTVRQCSLKKTRNFAVNGNVSGWNLYSGLNVSPGPVVQKPVGLTLG